jgi:hypothetical protein
LFARTIAEQLANAAENNATFLASDLFPDLLLLIDETKRFDLTVFTLRIFCSSRCRKHPHWAGPAAHFERSSPATPMQVTLYSK